MPLSGADEPRVTPPTHRLFLVCLHSDGRDEKDAKGCGPDREEGKELKERGGRG